MSLLPLSGRHLSPAEPAVAQKEELGGLPVWDLSDLYAAMDAPEVAADLAWAAKEAEALKARFKDRIAEIAATPEGGSALAEAIRATEKIEDRLGRLISYAGLLYAQDNTNPANGKFYGDIQERITAVSTELLFLPLEHHPRSG